MDLLWTKVYEILIILIPRPFRFLCFSFELESDKNLYKFATNIFKKNLHTIAKYIFAKHNSSLFLFLFVICIKVMHKKYFFFGARNLMQQCATCVNARERTLCIWQISKEFWLTNILSLRL
jgi:hypothetical protein